MSPSDFLSRSSVWRRAATAAVPLLGSALLLQGCTTLRSLFRSAGTYAVAAPTPVALNGRGEVRGSLLLTPALGNVMMEGRDPPPVAGLRTTVMVEPLGLSVETDPLGKFSLPHLDPGAYHLEFSDPDGREIWTEFTVAGDQRLEVVVWIQWNGADHRYMSEGTSPIGMFPGANGAYAISSGSSGRSRGGGKGGGGGG